jgi:putative heme-binding domain-containing protein
MRTALALGRGTLPEAEAKAILAQAKELPAGPIRDLFTGYLPQPPGERKLGTNPRPLSILSLTGNATRGQELYMTKTLNCTTCHKHGDAGQEVGPELTQIGTTRSREELLESLLLPSRRVDAKYQNYTVFAEDGRSVAGVLIQRDAKSTTVRDATGKDHIFTADNIVSLKPSRESLMPSGVLAELTPQQAADLLAYLKESTGR